MILIDLPMPEACDVCPFNYDFCWCNAFGNHDEWEKYSDDWNDHVCDRKTRPEYCPLKEQEALLHEYEKLSQVCFKIEKYLRIADLSILIDRIEEGKVEVFQDDGRPDAMETTIKIRRL